MNIEGHNAVCSLIDQMCASGKPQPDTILSLELKRLCKTSDDAIRSACIQLFLQLEKEHSQIRLTATQIINVLFTRSHLFRQLLVKDFQKYLSLTVGLVIEDVLPPPKKYAEILRTTALQNVFLWNKKFGPGYKQISLGFNHLQQKLKVDFTSIAGDLQRLEADAVRQAQQELAVRMTQVQLISNSFEDVLHEVSSCTTQLRTCLEIFFPHTISYPEPTGVTTVQSCPATLQSAVSHEVSQSLTAQSPEDKSEERERLLLELGLGSRDYQISISFPKDGTALLDPGNDTSDVLVVFHEYLRQAKHKYSPLLGKLLTKLDGLTVEGAVELYKRIAELQAEVVATCKQCALVKINKDHAIQGDDDDLLSDVESLVDDDEKEDYESDVVSPSVEDFSGSDPELQSAKMSTSKLPWPESVKAQGLLGLLSAEPSDLSDEQQLRDLGLLPPLPCDAADPKTSRKRRGVVKPKSDLIDLKKLKMSPLMQLVKQLKRNALRLRKT